MSDGYEVLVTPAFRCDFKKLDRQLQNQVLDVIKLLAEDGQGEALVGPLSGHYSRRVRRGWRIVFKREEYRIYLEAVGPHKICDIVEKRFR